ncbi:transposable element Tcb1 transposase [Trichonephila clavipes]|nr:transposable element Tcb1 transposase [Trichonephila clavipes]
MPLMQQLLEAIFQQDNARLHRASASQDCLPTVTTLPWPARSPYLSPIEHIWDHLGRRVWHTTSLNELNARLQQIWNEVSQDIIQNLYASMPDCIASRTCGRGGSTSYSRALGEGLRKFESWSSNEDDTRAVTPCPNYHTIPTGGRLSSRQI